LFWQLSPFFLFYFYYTQVYPEEAGFYGFDAGAVLPPYEVAIAKLDKIKQQKLWQQNRSKEYHTELTDVIREYIERTFDIPCMEMTSEEILEHLNHLKFETKPAYLALLQILRLADLVKFAKWNPATDEHELSLNNAYLFINQTKIEEVKPSEEGNEDTTDRLN